MTAADWSAWWFVLAARVTALALFILLVYGCVRRFSPRAGVLAAAWGLGAIAALPVLAILPGPRWSAPVGLPGWIAAEAERPRLTNAPSASERATMGAEPVEVLGDELSVARPLENRSGDASAADSEPVPSAATPRSVEAPAIASSSFRWLDGLALALAVSSGLGLIRLALALNAVERLKRASKPIEDRGLEELIDCLRAELSIPSAVELRETAALATPATVGWRHPMVLLPDDWRDWEPAELRLVLRHELAHIRRSDYLIGLIAQFTVALYVYHPLVHWLARWLRLDQELDADAVAAGLSGGRRPYLTCLARLALRRDDRASSGPARAFLPTKGTFLRRIDMLRRTRIVKTAEPPRLLKIVTVAALFGLATLCAGLQGPKGPSAALARQEAAKPKAAIVSGFDLTYVPRNAVAFFAIRPGALQGQEGLEDAVGWLERAVWEKLSPLEVPTDRWEQILVIESSVEGAEKRPRRSGPPIHPSLIAWRAIEPFEAEQAIAEAIGDRVAPRTFLGRTYHQLGNSTAIFAPDDRTWIVGEEDALRELIASLNRPNASQPWVETIEPLASGQLLVAFETPWLIQQFGDGRRRGPNDPMALLSPLFDRAYSYAFTLDALDGLSIDGVAWSGNEQGAARVGDTAEALRTLADNSLQSIRTQIRASSPVEAAEMGPLLDALESLIQDARIASEGTRTRLQAKVDLDPSRLARLTLPPLQAARTASDRTQAMNHLKQIGLALHNYHDASGSFPPPVLYSENGTPYSWRVAILPFVEQSALYDQYNFSEPWDSPNNLKVLRQAPEVFNVPGSNDDPTHADFFALVGSHTLMGPVPEPRRGGESRPATPGMSLRDVLDGTSNTIAIVEAKRPIPWTKPEDISYQRDLAFDPEQPLPAFGGFREGNFLALFADGSVKVISQAIDPRVLHAFFTRAGREVISREAFAPVAR